MTALAEMEKTIAEEVEHALRFAEESPQPAPKSCIQRMFMPI